ncbi:hypothetical protein A2837_02180 [Candidatus Kaiserbacteria bacterium RIFCSPHIGHO2_01_FULL_46_22]|uniref:Uncharacterized protein n=1 Tax=Candidatus Kaiserbacteria bacterium RIFCSPHIGHO2_01_FULL_46_22 TaxID=1798475 RepID=A0A1F6BYY9_9BACT|nr:MAG: hypothetical protein A2837_02180 [Candidatus Kaiserbacteria bacterium RIFCSPHIGHO2_01_FULL_46_22]
MRDDLESVSPFAILAADKLAMAVSRLVKRNLLDERSEAADALLQYALVRFGDRDPIGDLERHMEAKETRPPRHR